jgi:hypothetical protein
MFPSEWELEFTDNIIEGWCVEDGHVSRGLQFPLNYLFNLCIKGPNRDDIVHIQGPTPDINEKHHENTETKIFI